MLQTRQFYDPASGQIPQVGGQTAMGGGEGVTRTRVPCTPSGGILCLQVFHSTGSYVSGSRKHQVAHDPFPVDSANPCPADAENKVDDEGARALAEALRENSTLATLALDGAP